MAGKAKLPGPSSDRVAVNVRRLRRRLELSTVALSAALSRLGQPIQDTGITKIEKGDRRVDVDDLVALAVALDVTPNALLLPQLQLLPQGQQIPKSARLTPDLEMSPVDMWTWASGETPLTEPVVAARVDDPIMADLAFAMDARPHHWSSDFKMHPDDRPDLDPNISGSSGARINAAISLVVMHACREGFSPAEIRRQVQLAIQLAHISANSENGWPDRLDEARQAGLDRIAAHEREREAGSGE